MMRGVPPSLASLPVSQCPSVVQQSMKREKVAYRPQRLHSQDHF